MPPVGFEPIISAGVDLRLRPRIHWDRLLAALQAIKFSFRNSEQIKGILAQTLKCSEGHLMLQRQGNKHASFLPVM